MNMYNSFNPYQLGYNQVPQQYNGKIQVISVNGRNGAEALRLPPNSSILLLDETAPIIWLKITDGAGYPTLTPYDISPHQVVPVQQIDTSQLEQRIARLESIINEQYGEQSNVGSTQPIKRVVSVNANKESK